MEQVINDKILSYMENMKMNIANLVETSQSKDDIVRYIKDYPLLQVDRNDLTKKKRIKNIVPQYDRCIACIANKKQCTRRKKIDSPYCGTHDKGIPHGVFTTREERKEKGLKKMEVFIKDINGIHYYLDNDNNVYMTEDILNNIPNPRIMAIYVKDENGEYSIPEFQ